MNDRYGFNEVAEVILEKPKGLIFLLGGVDTGKTTLFKRLANSLLGAGVPVGLIDADVGQSTIGPPTAIGMIALSGADIELPELFQAHALYFAGSTNPVSRLTQVIIGSRLMADGAARAGSQVILFDSSGLVQPPYGHILKYHKLELLRPRYVIALEKRDELAPIRSWLSGCRGIELLRVKAPAEARSMAASRRQTYRQEQYRAYFKDALSLTLSADELCLYPPGFLSGKIDATGLLVGLQGEGWGTEAIGIIESVSGGEVTVLSPWPVGKPVRGLLAGYIKLSRDGIELGHIPPRQFL